MHCFAPRQSRPATPSFYRETTNLSRNVDNILILRAVEALASELAQALGHDWPAFSAMITTVSTRIAGASEDDQARLIDELLDYGLASPAADIFRRILQDSGGAASATLGVEQTRY